MYAIGICGRISSWLQTLLVTRLQIVRINHTPSDPAPIIREVIHDSALGSLNLSLLLMPFSNVSPFSNLSSMMITFKLSLLSFIKE